MFDSALLLIDRLITLVRTRDENKRNLFKDVIEPFFQEVQKAYEDYSRFIQEVNSLLNHSLTANEQEYIGQRRYECKALRMKLRVLASVYPDSRKGDPAFN